MAITDKIYMVLVFQLFFLRGIAQNSTIERLCKNALVFNKKVKELNDYDLSFLQTELKNESIVVIGETSHYSGLSLDLETKIIQYLHKYMGFDVLLMEDLSYYSGFKFKEYFGGYTLPLDTSKLLEYSLKFNMNRYKLFRYIQDAYWTKNQFKLGGININDKFYSADNKLLDSIATIRNKYGKQQIPDKLWSNIYSLVDKGIVFERDSMKKIVNILTKNIPAWDSKHLSLLQLLKNEICVYETYTNQDLSVRFGNKNEYEIINFFKLRDEQMADNILFYVNNYYKGHKIIISTTVYHSLKNISGYSEKKVGWNSGVPMCTILAQKYKLNFYTMAILANKGYEGEYALRTFESKKKHSIIKDSTSKTLYNYTYTVAHGDMMCQRYDTVRLRKKYEGGLEYCLGEKLKAEIAYVSFKNYKQSLNGAKPGNFALQPLYDSLYIQRDWTKSYDAVFFINKMKPVRKEGAAFKITAKNQYDEDHFPFKERKCIDEMDFFEGKIKSEDY